MRKTIYIIIGSLLQVVMYALLMFVLNELAIWIAGTLKIQMVVAELHGWFNLYVIGYGLFFGIGFLILNTLNNTIKKSPLRITIVLALILLQIIIGYTDIGHRFSRFVLTLGSGLVPLLFMVTIRNQINTAKI